MSIDQYLTYDKPVPYKNFLINPVCMKDYISFHECINCALLDKNSVPDVEVISMGYLTYIINLGFDFPILITQLIDLLKMVISVKVIKEDGTVVFEKLTDVEDIKLNKNDLTCLLIKGEKMASEDFDIVKDIVFIQNKIEAIDESISKEVRDELFKAEQFKQRQNENKIGSLEDQLVAVVMKTGLSFDYLYGLTIRKFTKILERADYELHYIIYMNAFYAGNIKMENGKAPKHWLSDLEEKDKHKNTKLAMDAIRSKLGDKT